jgi:DNA repair exonuclease SbcCD ATPase subunit
MGEDEQVEAVAESPSAAAPSDAEVESPSTEAASQDAVSEESTESPSATPAETAASNTTDDEPIEFRNALQKFGGSREALGKHYWQMAKANAALAEKVRAFEQASSKQAPDQKAPGQPPATPAPVPQDIEKLDQRITAYEAKLKTAGGIQQSTLKTIDELRAEIIRLEDRRDRAFDDEKEGYAKDIVATKRALNDQIQRYYDAKEREESFRESIESLKERRLQAQSRIEAEQARQEQASRESQAFAQEFPTRVAALTAQFAEEFKLPMGTPELKADIERAVADLTGMAFFRLAKAGITEIRDVQGVVREQVKALSDLVDRAARAKYTATSAAKLAVTAPVRSPSNGPATKPAERKDDHGLSKEEAAVFERARKRLAAFGR